MISVLEQVNPVPIGASPALAKVGSLCTSPEHIRVREGLVGCWATNSASTGVRVLRLRNRNYNKPAHLPYVGKCFDVSQN
jgi:hypothetical protein